MQASEFIHNDPDSCHDETVTLHDCIADRASFSDGVLRFYLPDGLWVTPLHSDNPLDKTVRTDAAEVEFRVEDINDITLRVFTSNIFRQTKAELWEMKDFINDMNSGKYSVEFIFQYRTYFEQMWSCAIHTRSKHYYAKCQMHLPGASAVYHWNRLRPDCEW